MIMYDVNEGFDAYKTYLALKQHFTSDYDYFKYNGKVRAKSESFLKRNDKFFFRKLQKKYSKDELVEFFVSNFIVGGNNWIGNLISKESEDNYANWRKSSESITYNFHNDLRWLSDYCSENDISSNDLIVVSENDHPILLKLFLQNKITTETVIILDSVLGFVRYWNAKIDDIIWDEKRKLLNNYKSFVRYDIDKCKQLTKDTLL
mgnify:FL=1|tara:strand:+ start:907 stop:1521 length:615 start_codon:yes stop_codon:yes gene_type:complete